MNRQTLITALIAALMAFALSACGEGEPHDHDHDSSEHQSHHGTGEASAVEHALMDAGIDPYADALPPEIAANFTATCRPNCISSSLTNMGLQGIEDVPREALQPYCACSCDSVAEEMSMPQLLALEGRREDPDALQAAYQVMRNAPLPCVSEHLEPLIADYRGRQDNQQQAPLSPE